MSDPETNYGGFFFPDRTTLGVPEIAEKLMVSTKHITNLIEDGELNAVNTSKDTKNKRANYRIPVEAYNEFITQRLVHSAGASILFDLHEAVQLDLYRRLKTKFESGEPKQ